MRLIFLANARIPSEKAHPLQIMHMAEAFAAQGLEALLLHARRDNTDTMLRVDNPFAYFGVAPAFALIGLPCIDLIKRVTVDWPVFYRGPIPQLAHLLQLVTFTLSALVLVRRLRGDVIYSRDLFPLTLTTLRRRAGDRSCFECHTLPRSAASQWLHLWAVRRVDRIVVITSALRRWYLERGLPPERVLVAHDAAPAATFDLEPRTVARQALDLALDAPLVCYVGHLYPWKGVDTLVAAAAKLPDTVQFAIVGGIPPDLDRVRQLAGGRRNVRTTGHRPPAEARRYLAAADVAVIPFSGATIIAREHTSPLKMFEYMAAGVPIVASDLPSLREVLRHEHNALLVPPDDNAALAAAIERLLSDHELAARLARTARNEVADCTWNRRAARIVEFLDLPQPA
ncbi:MAG: glycosyltransferase [Chloroflexi bacterium]|nr:glycosyltransferase [Chloroflexota bacterium]